MACGSETWKDSLYITDVLICDFTDNINAKFSQVKSICEWANDSQKEQFFTSKLRVDFLKIVHIVKSSLQSPDE